MSDQVLAGFDPLAAAQSQIFLMFLLSAASVGSVWIGWSRPDYERYRSPAFSGRFAAWFFGSGNI